MGAISTQCSLVSAEVEGEESGSLFMSNCLVVDCWSYRGGSPASLFSPLLSTL